MTTLPHNKEEATLRIAEIKRRRNAITERQVVNLSNLEALGIPDDELIGLREKIQGDSLRKIDETRTTYIKEYTKHIALEGNIEKTKKALFAILGKVKNVSGKEKTFNDNLQKYKEAYDAARVSYATQLYERRRADLEKEGDFNKSAIEKELWFYKVGEIRREIIIKEREKFIKAQVENIFSVDDPTWNKIEKVINNQYA
jgi:hypothetical protein